MRLLLSETEAAKQNQKFPFHFLSAPPTPPAELNQKGRKIFGFCPRESASATEAQSERTIQFQATTRSARATLVGVLLEMGSDFFKQTPHISAATLIRASRWTSAYCAFAIVSAEQGRRAGCEERSTKNHPGIIRVVF